MKCFFGPKLGYLFPSVFIPDSHHRRLSAGQLRATDLKNLKKYLLSSLLINFVCSLLYYLVLTCVKVFRYLLISGISRKFSFQQIKNTLESFFLKIYYILEAFQFVLYNIVEQALSKNLHRSQVIGEYKL